MEKDSNTSAMAVPMMKVAKFDGWYAVFMKWKIILDLGGEPPAYIGLADTPADYYVVCPKGSHIVSTIGAKSVKLRCCVTHSYFSDRP